MSGPDINISSSPLNKRSPLSSHFPPSVLSLPSFLSSSLSPFIFLPFTSSSHLSVIFYLLLMITLSTPLFPVNSLSLSLSLLSPSLTRCTLSTLPSSILHTCTCTLNLLHQGSSSLLHQIKLLTHSSTNCYVKDDQSQTVMSMSNCYIKVKLLRQSQTVPSKMIKLLHQSPSSWYITAR